MPIVDFNYKNILILFRCLLIKKIFSFREIVVCRDDFANQFSVRWNNKQTHHPCNIIIGGGFFIFLLYFSSSFFFFIFLLYYSSLFFFFIFILYCSSLFFFFSQLTPLKLYMNKNSLRREIRKRSYWIVLLINKMKPKLRIEYRKIK